MDVARFARLRPFLYHVTARENLESIARRNILEPAAELMRRAGRTDLLRWKRALATPLSVDEVTITLPDQLAFAPERTALYRGWEFADFIEYMNELVFFWPGTATGPAKTGVLSVVGDDRNAAILRVDTGELLELNPDTPPLFCGINVRASRSADTRRVSRGPRLFTTADEFPRREVEVVEVAFRSGVVLPESTTFRRIEDWIPLGSR